MLFAGLGSVCMVKNCDFGLENAIRTSQPEDKIYIYYKNIEAEICEILTMF